MNIFAFLKKKNNAAGELVTSFDLGQSDFRLQTGQGAQFPDGNFKVTIEDEIVYVISRSTELCSTLRAQEGTAEAYHPSGTPVQLRITEGIFSEIEDSINDVVGEINTHEADIAAHGATGAVVGTTKTQTLTNKTLVSPVIADLTNVNHSHADAAGGGLIVTVPTGCMLPFVGAAAPSGYLLCQGQAISRATYATLFGVIGTTYGVGDGTTTFNLPNMQDKFPIGASGTKLRNGTGGGVASINFEHAHTVNNHAHGIQTGGWHGHSGIAYGSGDRANYYTYAPDGYNEVHDNHAHSVGVYGEGNHAHGCDGSAPGTNNALGTNVSVINPWIAFNFIIRT